MLTFRLYIALLTLLFLAVNLLGHSLGLLHAVIVTCSLLFLILDTKKDLDADKKLEAEIAEWIVS